MTLAWWQLATLALIVVAVGQLLVAAYRNGWDYVGEKAKEFWWVRPRPLATWRAQSVWQRRRQVLAGLAVAAVIAMLLAIALRGIFVYVFVATTGLTALAMIFAVLRGGVELRRGPQTVGRQLSELRTDYGPDVELEMGPYAETGIFPSQSRPVAAEVGPIIDRPPVVGPSTVDDETPLMFEPLGIDPFADQEPVVADQEPRVSEQGPGVVGPSFSAAPSAGQRQASARARARKRHKARPIYIESVLDSDEGEGPASGRVSKGH